MIGMRTCGIVFVTLAAMPVAGARTSDCYRILDPDHRNGCLAETP